jgi:hypothetical protein
VFAKYFVLGRENLSVLNETSRLNLDDNMTCVKNIELSLSTRTPEIENRIEALAALEHLLGYRFKRKDLLYLVTSLPSNENALRWLV